MEKSRYVADVHHLRLMSLLQELVRDKGGIKGAARVLGVDHRTVTASLVGGELSRRVREALERLLLAGGGSAAARQREETDALEQRIDGVERETRRALRAIEGGIEALREDQVEDTRGVKRRLGQVEAGLGARSEAEAPVPVGPPRGRTAPRRDYPDLATREPAPDDEEVFGPAWPLIVEWRRLKDSHPNQGKGLAWLVTEERLMEVEVALLEEHGLTLPPERQPLRGLDRGAQLNWRRTALYDHPAGAGQGRAAAVGAEGADLQSVAEVGPGEARSKSC